MKKSCTYCGRIHEKDFDCGKLPKTMKPRNEKNQFRSTAAWQKKRADIKERDHYICQICLRNLYRTTRRLNHENLEVHHIIPLEEDSALALEDGNLITLCERHHKMAERGEIARAELQKIAAESPQGATIKM